MEMKRSTGMKTRNDVNITAHCRQPHQPDDAKAYADYGSGFKRLAR